MERLALSFAGFGSLTAPCTLAEAVTAPLFGAFPEIRIVADPPAASEAKEQVTVAAWTAHDELDTDTFDGEPPSCMVRDAPLEFGPAFRTVASTQKLFFGLTVAADAFNDTPMSAEGGGGGGTAATLRRTTRPLL
jgi:hypothetical protein